MLTQDPIDLVVHHLSNMPCATEKYLIPQGFYWLLLFFCSVWAETSPEPPIPARSSEALAVTSIAKARGYLTSRRGSPKMRGCAATKRIDKVSPQECLVLRGILFLPKNVKRAKKTETYIRFHFHSLDSTPDKSHPWARTEVTACFTSWACIRLRCGRRPG